MNKKYIPVFQDDYNPNEDQHEQSVKENLFEGAQNGTKIRRKETMSEKMQFYVSPDMKEKILKFAKAQGVSYADVVRSLMADFIEKNGL